MKPALTREQVDILKNMLRGERLIRGFGFSYSMVSGQWYTTPHGSSVNGLIKRGLIVQEKGLYEVSEKGKEVLSTMGNK